MSNCAVVGINWGDEGKGRMVDLLTEDFDVVVRYQGGGNAGHTVINEYGKFALHLLPSGIFRPGVVNVLGPGVALDLQSLWEEIELLRANGVYITPENLMISERAGLLLPWHKEQDALEERRLGAHKYGSTGQGIAPFYSDKYQKKTLQAGDLAYPAQLRERLAGLLEWKNLILTRVYGAPGHELGEIEAWLENTALRCGPTYATRAASSPGPRPPARAYSSRPSSAPCATWSRASAPTPPRPTPWQPTHSWAAGLSRGAWTRSWA